ncbi:hypothetical protein ABPG77_002046 [Micractinium sp. CCAP 211/92]
MTALRQLDAGQGPLDAHATPQPMLPASGEPCRPQSSSLHGLPAAPPAQLRELQSTALPSASSRFSAAPPPPTRYPFIATLPSPTICCKHCLFHPCAPACAADTMLPSPTRHTGRAPRNV